MNVKEQRTIEEKIVNTTLASLINKQEQMVSDVNQNVHSVVSNYFTESRKQAYYEALEHLLNNSTISDEVVKAYAELNDEFGKIIGKRTEVQESDFSGKNLIFNFIKEKESLEHLWAVVKLDRYKSLLQQGLVLHAKVIKQKEIIEKNLKNYSDSLETMLEFNSKQQEVPIDVLRYFTIVEMHLKVRTALAADLKYLEENLSNEIEYLKKASKSTESGALMRSIETSVKSVEANKDLSSIFEGIAEGMTVIKVISIGLLSFGVGRLFYWILTKLLSFQIYIEHIDTIAILWWVGIIASFLILFATVALNEYGLKKLANMVGCASLAFIVFLFHVFCTKTPAYISLSLVLTIGMLLGSVGLAYLGFVLGRQSKLASSQFKLIEKLIKPE